MNKNIVNSKCWHWLSGEMFLLVDYFSGYIGSGVLLALLLPLDGSEYRIVITVHNLLSSNAL